jgi:hypothetical protein
MAPGTVPSLATLRHARRHPLALLAAVVALLALSALLLLERNVDVLARGQLLADDGVFTEIAKVRLFGAITLYVDVSPLSAGDLLNGVVLVAIAGAALLAVVLLGATSSAPAELRSFFKVVVFAAAWLAADEMLSIHETVGDNLLFLSALPGVHHPDDALMLLYGVVAVVLFVRFRHVILGSRAAIAWYALAAACFGAAVACDMLLSTRVEEFLEVAATVAFLGGFITLARDHVLRAIGGLRAAR